MSNRQLFSIAAKQLGRTLGHLQLSQGKRSVATLARPLSSPVWGSSNESSCEMGSHQNTGFSPSGLGSRLDASCYCKHNFSDMPLRRPPPRHKKKGLDKNNSTNSDTTQKWRSHAVSLGFGDYRDDYQFDEYDEDDYSDSGVSLETTSSPDPSRTKPSWDQEESELAEQVQKLQREEDERRKRWLENAKPPVRQSVVDERGRAYGRGGRKTASARVWIQPGFGNVVVNRKEFVDYFDRMSDRELILEPLAATETLGRFDVTAIVEGGGLRGQAGAIRHGLARALNHYNPDVYRPPLKRLGYLTRDPRKVERKKIGHLKARKKPQWVKR